MSSKIRVDDFFLLLLPVFMTIYWFFKERDQIFIILKNTQKKTVLPFDELAQKHQSRGNKVWCRWYSWHCFASFPRFFLQVYSWIVKVFVVEGKSHRNRGNSTRNRCHQQEGLPRRTSLGPACWREGTGLGRRKGSVPNQENVTQNSGIVVCLVGESNRK